MAFTITSKIKQLGRSVQVDKAAYFHAVDSIDVNYGVNAFQSQVSNVFTEDEAYRYIIDNPYDVDTVTGAEQDVGSGLYVLNGKTLGTGDIIESLQYEVRESRGETYELVYDSSNGGPLSNNSLGMIGTIIFNDYDKNFYGWNGTTWSDLVSDYVKSVTSVGGTITVTKGNGDQNTIDIGITTGVSGDVSNFTKELNFIGGTNADINIGTDSTTSNITFNVSRMEAGTFS